MLQNNFNKIIKTIYANFASETFMICNKIHSLEFERK